MKRSIAAVATGDTNSARRSPTAAKVGAGLQHKVEQGWHPGRVPLGYRQHTGKVVVDRRTAALVTQAFELTAAGEPLRYTLKTLRGQGLDLPGGKQLRPYFLYAMLTNPFYAGLIRFEGNQYPGAHEPLVSRDVFEGVQRRLRQPARRRIRLITELWV